MIYPDKAISFSTINRLLKHRAAERPGRTAFIFLKDGEFDEERLTYANLDHRARAVAALLQEFSIEGERVILLYPPGLDYIVGFFGCLYAGAIAVPAYPPRRKSDIDKIRAVLKDADARFIITSAAIASRLRLALGEIEHPRWVTTDSLSDDLPDRWREPAINADHIAFLQYTSGSTSMPRGVMVSHANALCNERAITSAFRQTESSVIVGWLPLYHDMGLIGTVLQPLYTGATGVLMTPASFLQKPARWLQAITRFKATTSGGPNFAYELCVRRVTEDQFAALDLSSWQVAFNGAEPVRSDDLDRFADRFRQVGFRRQAFVPCYGLAEATLFVSGGVRESGPLVTRYELKALGDNRAIRASSAETRAVALVGCGEPPPEMTAMIVDPDSCRHCPPGTVGEIWIAGPSVASGYWGREQETRATFAAHVADIAEGPFLRTGDLGFIDNGEIFVTGRLKDLIIIRGHNHYPQDIELTVERSHPAFRPGCGAAFSLEVAGRERLAIAQEIDLKSLHDLDAAVESIRRAVAERHEIQPRSIALIRPGAIPKTSSGKVRRQACRDLLLSRSLRELHQWTAKDDPVIGSIDSSTVPPADSPEEIEGQIADYLSLRFGISRAEIEADQPITTLGLDSLAMVELAHMVELQFSVEEPLTSFYDGVTIADLAAKCLTPIPFPAPVVKSDATICNAEVEYPLSRGQEALFFLQQLEPESSAYNIANAVRIRGEIDVESLRRAFQTLVDRHPLLRTTFFLEGGKPYQRINEKEAVSFSMVNARGMDEGEFGEVLSREAGLPFDLERGPLMRVRVFVRSSEEHILLLIIHHIISDLWSLAVLARELGIFYSAERNGVPAEVRPPESSYGRFVNWQTETLTGAEGERCRSYWMETLATGWQPLNLPADRPRPPVQTFDGASRRFSIDAVTAERLTAIALRQGATLYATLLACFQAFLHKLTGQSDFLVGAPAAARSRAEFAGLVGYFVNMVVLRAKISPETSFEELLDETQREANLALRHQDYPFASLVEQAQPDRDPSLSPLFQVMFALQKAPSLVDESIAALAVGAEGARAQLGELRLEAAPINQNVSQFDLSLIMAERKGAGLSACLQYNTDLFDAATIDRFVANFLVLIDSVATSPSQTLSRLSMLSEAERRKLIYDWNDTGRAYPENSCLHEIIEEQSGKTPDNLALIFRDESLTYLELNRRANQLAWRLRDEGVGPESLVGICVERSFEMMIGVLAIMKAGGAYAPLDPTYPADRLAYMMEDAGIEILLTRRRDAVRLPAHGKRAIDLEEERELIAHYPAQNLDRLTTADNLAYVIYTSGSTGKPKGAMNTHRGIVNRLLWMQEEYELTETDRVLQKTPMSFDVSVWEMLWPLTQGAAIVLAEPGRQGDSVYLADEMRSSGVTTVHFVPGMLAMMIEEKGFEKCESLKRVICSGEALTQELKERFYEKISWAQLSNLYGPTEAAVDVTSWRATPGERVVIGKPIANIQIYILDEEKFAVPVGVAGEIYIAGRGLGRGYFSHADLTAERFIPNPYSLRDGERMYKSGDLARYLADGSIEFLGRKDHQVKVRGFRIEPGEIESALRQIPSISEALVMARPSVRAGAPPSNYRVSGELEAESDEFRAFLKANRPRLAPQDSSQRLVAYLSLDASQAAPTVSEIRAKLRESLPDYMIPAAFVFLEKIPLLPNGKIDRRALPEPERRRSELDSAYAPPQTAAEALLVRIWSETLGIDQIGIHDNFFDLGGDSIRSIQVRAKAQEEGLSFTLQDIFRSQTIYELARIAKQEDGQAASSVFTEPLSLVSAEDRDKLPAGVEDAYPLSRVQAGLIFHCQYHPDSAIYHDVFMYKLRAKFAEEPFREAIAQVMRRHANLRVSFDLSNFSEPLQLAHREVEAPLTIIDLRGLSEPEQRQAQREWIEAEKRNHIDWTRPPLIRFFIHRLKDDVFQFTLSFHDTILDGWSTASMLTEILQRYSLLLEGIAMPAEPPPVSYREFVATERATLNSEECKRYWDQKLSDCSVTKIPRWNNNGKTGADIGVYDVNVAPETSEGLLRLARNAGAPLKHVLLAAHLRVMSFVSGQRDCLTGLESNGRLEVAGGDQTLGVFINIAPFRQRLDGGSWIDLIKETFANETEMLPFRRYPLFDLQKTRNRQTLFEAVFNYTYFHVFKRLQGMPELQILGARGFEQTNFIMRVEFNQNPFTDLIQLDLVYDPNEITGEQIERIGGYYARTLKLMADDPLARYEHVSLLSEQERRQILSDWNAGKEFAVADCLHEMFEAQVKTRPHSTALIFEESSVSYAELNCRANQLARRMRQCGVRAGDLVGLCLERTPEIVISILAILKSGAAYVPLDPHYPKERIAFMLDDAGIRALITQERLIETLPPHTAPAIFVDTACGPSTEDEGEDIRVAVPAESPAYVIYTSGSTGKPKGALVSHANVARLFKATEEWYGFDEKDVWTLFHSYAFDFSVWEMWGALLYGGRLVIAPYWVSRSPGAFYELLEKERVTILNQTPSAFRQLIKAEEKRERASKLRLRYVIFGGEALDFSSLAPWFERHSERAPRLVNMYGITETTVHVTYQPVSAEASIGRKASLIGGPITDLQVYLLDDHLQPVPPGAAGEIYVGGAGLSHGYLNRPALTAERFIPDPFGARLGEKLYKTGDVGRYLLESGAASGAASKGMALECLGRSDHQVKIRGFRIELGEIESAVKRYPLAREAVVIAMEDEPSAGRLAKRLVGYVVARTDQPLSISELRTFTAKLLPDFMVPATFVQLEALPLTPEGKIDRRALPQPPSRPALDGEFVAPRSGIEEKLARIWSGVLGIERIGANDNFFDLGGHSLLATQLISRVKEALNVDVPLRALFEEFPTISGLAAYIKSLEASDGPRVAQASAPLLPATREGHLPLSFAQQRLYFMGLMSPDNPFYNITVAVRLKGQFDIDALEASINEIVRRHEVLRTRFEIVDGQPVQIISPSLLLKIQRSDFVAQSQIDQETFVQREIRQEAMKPFDLGAGPLIRLKLISLGEAEHALVLSMHHIVSDGWSMGIFIREMALAYEAFSSRAQPALAPLPVQYTDFAVWQRERLKGQLFENCAAYWKRKLDGLPTLRLPTDFPRPAAMSWRGTSHPINLPADLTRSLKELGRAEESSLFMTLLAGFKALLSYHSGQEDIIVGSDVANRNVVETEQLIGFFVNQIALRTNLSGDPTFRTLLSKIRETALGAYAHQDLPFDRLVEIINPPRERNRTPLFQVKFVLQNAPMPPLALPGLELSLIEFDSGTAKFDLLFNLWENEGGLFGGLEYSADLFRQETVTTLLRQFSALLREVVTNPDLRLSQLKKRLDEIADQERRLERDNLRALHHSMLKSTVPKTVSVLLPAESGAETTES